MKPTAVILAGGMSTRFSPFLTNKTMWPLCGKTALQHTLDMVQAAGVERVVVVANKINSEYLRTHQSITPNLVVRLQNEALGMDDALKSVADLISKSPILVLNAIDFIDANLIKRVLSRVETDHPPLLVCGMKTSSYVPAIGYYVLEQDRVRGVVEKPDEGKQPSDVIRHVFDYFENPSEFIALFDEFTAPHEKDARYELAQDVLLKKYGAPIEYSSYWAKLKYPHSVLDVMNTFQKHVLRPHIDPTAHISPHALIEGVVHIDKEARIEAGTIIKGPTYIGKRVIIGNNVLVRQSFIEESATVGFGSEIARSYVGPDCQIHHSFVGDSVLEKAVNMSWGTVTANLRLDRKNVSCKLPDGTRIPSGREKLGALIAQGSFLGVNVSTMPGVCVAAGSNILPGSVVK
jgi:bifunctional UDP-N-acetylglucosamine pyrophosphorylase/glucosamine-1-phosphate N-acetyltransferase